MKKQTDTGLVVDAVAIPIQSVNMVRDKKRNGIGIGTANDPMFTMTGRDQHAVQVQWASGGGKVENPTAQALRSGAEHNYQFARTGTQVRRLTPRECERLQGFPDDYSLISYNGKPAKDGPRYEALGNSMAVNVMSWIGQRIQMVDKIIERRERVVAGK
jgi:DNA (cytosine-5)-methyltransferase 1